MFGGEPQSFEDRAFGTRVREALRGDAEWEKLVERVISNGLEAAWANPRYRGPVRTMLRKVREAEEMVRIADAVEEGLRHRDKSN